MVAEHFVAGKERTSDCGAKGINRGAHKEGTCTEGGTKLVVVNQHSVLKLPSLEARLLGIDQRKTIDGPGGSKTTKGKFAIFDLAITNLTDAPAKVVEGQCMLYLVGLYSEAVEVEERFEPQSFLHRDQEIPPQGTEEGTVVFSLGNHRAPKLRTDGNLDCVNLGSSVSPLEPEGLFDEPEYGVIRTYQ